MKRYVSLSLVLALGVSVYADESQASQDLSTKEEVRLDKVTVTAQSMRSELDELNRSVYKIDKEQIAEKGYRSSEDIFRYTPFIGVANTGLGGNLDLRGQGNRANTSVQVLINGNYSNMLDSSHGVTPLNTLSPNSIESIEILPGGGAVMYGNGTRGGVVNILTQRRYETPYFSAGLSYSNTVASVGNNYNADVRVGGKIGEGTYITTSAAYIDRGGPRLGDRTNGAQGSFGITKDFNTASSLSFDIDYFAGIIRTTPNNSFNDIANPTKSDRGTAGNGLMNNSQRRLDVSLAWNTNLSENSKFDLRAFYHLNKITYDNSITNLTNYQYGNFGFATTSANQSGSLFNDQKVGLNAKYDVKHTSGRFILGLESVYQISKRTMEQLINASGGTGAITQYEHPMHIAFNGNKWNTALFALEKYDFGSRFSLTGGARYEYAYYDIDVLNRQTISMTGGAPQPIQINANGYLKDSLHNYALEITPNLKYSDNGNIFVKYEKGFFSPSPNSMLTRSGNNYITTDLKQEEYHTFELGLKDFWGSSVAFSASVFYTLTTNEFYTIGNAHSASGVVYGNYDKTQRAGAELFSEQYFLDGSLSFSESFTYIDARILRNNGASVKNLLIPYVSNYKATIGVNYALGRSFGIWIQNSFYGQSKDIETFTTTGQGPNAQRTSNGQKTIPAYNLTDIGINAKIGDLSLSAGVRNVFDTFYYSYYNGDASDTVAGYGFLIGAGRSIFVEGRLTF